MVFGLCFDWVHSLLLVEIASDYYHVNFRVTMYYIQRQNVDLAERIDHALQLLSSTEHEAALRLMQRDHVPLVIISRLLFTDQKRPRRDTGEDAGSE